jgi:molybdopterin-guanine dinucleotide biosynthesis protein B
MIAAELRGALEPSLEAHLARLSDCDLVLVEGYRHADLPKLEVHRAETGQPWLHPNDPHILAVVSDEAAGTLPCFALDASALIAHFILEHARHVDR